MPLIIVCGRPCVGKTTFSKELKGYIEAQGVGNVVLINEEALQLSKKNGYQSSAREKDLRGALKSAVDHALNSSTFVILDSLNYIKGYRYELYCTARTMRAPHCVVWVASDEETSNAWEESRSTGQEDRYDPLILMELRRRFEVPNDSNRWDNPLFRVRMGEIRESSDPVAAVSKASPREVEAPPAAVVKTSWRPKKAVGSTIPVLAAAESKIGLEKSETEKSEPKNGLWFSGNVVEAREDLKSFSSPDQVFGVLLHHLLYAHTPLPSSATVAAPHAQADLLYELDRTSQKIVNLLISHQVDASEGTPLLLPEFDRSLTLHRHAAAAELQRLRGQWVKINAQHPQASTKDIGASFIDFLAVHL